ncbi:MAG: helix-hairpin-helix domain-containing protein [Chloroflexota bacterium]|jgi:competence protein ComEA
MKIGWSQLVGILAVGLLLVGAGYGLATISRARQPVAIEIIPPQPTAISLPTAEPLPTPTDTPVRVYVSGAVLDPAVYTLMPGSIIDDAVRAAGGFAPGADRIAVNLAQGVVDGMQIYVPVLGEADPPPVINAPTVTVPDIDRLGGITVQGLININTASQRDLELLPGIGPAMAERIIAHREANGPFATVEAIMDVSGIGDAKFEAIRDLITVEP